jgi:hypothetical protein
VQIDLGQRFQYVFETLHRCYARYPGGSRTKGQRVSRLWLGEVRIKVTDVVEQGSVNAPGKLRGSALKLSLYAPSAGELRSRMLLVVCLCSARRHGAAGGDRPDVRADQHDRLLHAGRGGDRVD